MKMYTDAARDDEIAAMGWEIILTTGEQIEGNRYIVEDYTSMEVEYFALLEGLRFARRRDEMKLEAFTDCKPLVDKILTPAENDVWSDRQQGARRLLNKFDLWELEWTPRSANTTADRLAYEALEDGRQS